MAGAKTKRGKNEMNTEAVVPEGSPAFTRYSRPPIMGNPAVVTMTELGEDMRERQIMEPNLEDVADYGSTREQATSELSKESKEYTSSRGFYHGGEVCKGGGKAIRGLGFKGVK